jgi:predicted Zn-dependent protease
MEFLMNPHLRARFLVAALAMSAVVAGCAVNPATGERELSLISESQEVQMGREYDPQIVAQMGLYPDQEWQDYVQELGSRLAAQSERPNLPWTFRVIDDPVVNAFALPGGFIYITRGILAHFGSEAQLAAVLGHEIGHVTARHSVHQASQAQLAQLGLVVGMVLAPELQDYAGIAGAGLQLLFLKYGRDDERQADDLGLRYILRGNFDPREMPEVFAMLGRVSQAGGGGRSPEWLSTHPNPENRYQRIQQAIAQLPQDFSGTVVNRDSYLLSLHELVYGQNPRDGFFRDNRFLHPDLAFEFTFPTGWKTQNQRSAVLAISQEEDAIMQLTVAEESSPMTAARAFFGQEGVSGSPVSTDVNGSAAAEGRFTATTEEGTLGGRVLFVAHQGSVFRILGYASSTGWPSYDATARSSLHSFRRLTDRAALNAQPMRLSILRLDRGLSPEQFLQLYPSPITPEVASLLNQISPGGLMMSGQLVKRVVGDRLP